MHLTFVFNKLFFKKRKNYKISFYFLYKIKPWALLY